ncbi:hypothetical protein Tco_0619706 [Tanacetum coccineum]
MVGDISSGNASRFRQLSNDVQWLMQGLSNVAEEVGVTVGLKHKKINVSNSREAWGMNSFQGAATLSGLSAPPELLGSTGGLFDNREFVNEAAVVKSVKVRHIYGQQGKNINILADNSSLACIHHGIKEASVLLVPIYGSSYMDHPMIEMLTSIPGSKFHNMVLLYGLSMSYMGCFGAYNSSDLQLANTSMEYNPLYDADNVMPSSVMLSLKQLLLPYCKTVELKRFDGSRAGIDGQHQAAFSCCRDLALGRHTLKFSLPKWNLLISKVTLELDTRGVEKGEEELRDRTTSSDKFFLKQGQKY